MASGACRTRDGYRGDETSCSGVVSTGCFSLVEIGRGGGTKSSTPNNLFPSVLPSNGVDKGLSGMDWTGQ